MTSHRSVSCDSIRKQLWIRRGLCLSFPLHVSRATLTLSILPYAASFPLRSDEEIEAKKLRDSGLPMLML